ncbi:uncharacterized protein VTP21DRAFT_1670 [Calcarisporiella thermophila]|uniref:uncharacterized protein n=1 Tax=Calcarisporiella thermophila TaxID=911321 RepID=UPI0037447FAA
MRPDRYKQKASRRYNAKVRSRGGAARGGRGRGGSSRDGISREKAAGSEAPSGRGLANDSYKSQGQAEEVGEYEEEFSEESEDSEFQDLFIEPPEGERERKPNYSWKRKLSSNAYRYDENREAQVEGEEPKTEEQIQFELAEQRKKEEEESRLLLELMKEKDSGKTIVESLKEKEPRKIVLGPVNLHASEESPEERQTGLEDTVSSLNTDFDTLLLINEPPKAPKTFYLHGKPDNPKPQEINGLETKVSLPRPQPKKALGAGQTGWNGSQAATPMNLPRIPHSQPTLGGTHDTTVLDMKNEKLNNAEEWLDELLE